MMAKKVSYFGIMLALSLIFSYLEALLPLPLPVPGVKLGLANLVTVILLSRDGSLPAAGVNIGRILLSGLLFGNLQGTLIGLCGGVCSLAAMILLKKCPAFSLYGISMAGGAAHGAGQIFAATVLLSSPALLAYLPILMLTGAAAGWIIAYPAVQILPRLSAFSTTHRDKSR